MAEIFNFRSAQKLLSAAASTRPTWALVTWKSTCVAGIWPGTRRRSLNPALDLGRTQVNGFSLQVMVRFDKADGPASGPHQDRVSRCNRPLDADSLQQRALADPGRGKHDIIPTG